MQAHWAKYLCVLCAGFIENALGELYVEYVGVRSAPPVANYAIASLRKIQNPKSQRFIEVAGAFDRTWAQDLKDYLEQENRTDAIDSIMNNRHQIAHGKHSGVTIIQLRQWFDKALEVIEFIELQTK